MANFFTHFGFHVDPGLVSSVENDYWEELSKVNETFVPGEPDILIQQPRKRGILENQRSNKVSSEPPVIEDADNQTNTRSDFASEYPQFRSVGVQTVGDYDKEPDLPYKCCCCCRSSTPFIVWVFVGISMLFFKMGAIVTGRWIYLSSTTFDEIVFYITFTICLGFATIYFRRGTKYHNPYDLFFLVLTVPIMWAMLTFTTVFLKKDDLFFYIGSGIYSALVIPYTVIGSYIAYRFWKQGKMFLRRAEGKKNLEPYCRKFFFTQSLMMFESQLTICSGIISMAPVINRSTTSVWISSLVVAPTSIGCAIVTLLVGYCAIRRESRKLTFLFSLLSVNKLILVACMIAKRPMTSGAYSSFINVALVLASTVLLAMTFFLQWVTWNWVVPNYGKGVKGAVNRTSQNNCIQCTQITVCH